MAARRAACVLVISLLLSGCQATKAMTKLGLVGPFEGVYRDLGYEALYGVRLAIEESNRNGGVRGYMVELVALDDGGESDRAVEQAEEMALDPEVMGVVGHLRAETTCAALPVYHREGLALLIPPVALEPASYREVFWLGAPRSALERVAVEYAMSTMGAENVGVIGRDFDAQLKVAYPLRVYAGLDDFLSSSGADFLLFRGGEWEAAGVLKRLRDEGVSTRLLGGENLDSPRLVSWAGEAAEGSLYATSDMPVADPDFRDRYRALAGMDPGPRASMAYDGAKILLLALERAIEEDGKPTRAGVIRALGEVTYDGLSGHVAFDGKGYRESTATRLYIIEDGYPGRRVR